MPTPSPSELRDALRAIQSLISKCDKVQEKLRPGSPQHTLTKNRLAALRLSRDFLQDALENAG